MGINQRIALYLKNKLDLSNDDEEVMVYSLELLSHTLISTFSVLLVSLLIGSFRESLVVLVVMYFLKSFSGGAHCSSAFRCLIFSVLIIPFFGIISLFLSRYTSMNVLISMSVFCILFSSIIIFLLAPVDSPAKPINSAKHRQNLRILSFSFLIILAVTQLVLIILEPISLASIIICINISMFWQAFMLTKQGHAFIDCCDQFLTVTKRGGEKDEIHSTHRSS